MSGLQSLEYLDLRANALTAVPEDVHALPKLRKLDLRWNRLETVPANLRLLAERGCLVYM
jgi:Leucine-rich repeat (LRR) protein